MDEKEIKSEREWNDYWSEIKVKKSLYGKIANFYRKFIIKKTLNYFIKKYFQKSSKLLHAGCGSGQVDEDISKIMKISALDLSENALKLYKHHNKTCETIQGSIFNIPKESYFDGIYNLGVMEHFTQEDIHKIMLEFKRVLKPKGKIILFWPPEFGLTVNVLKVIHFILNKVLKRKTQLHPKEISRIKSKKQALRILNNSGFKMVKYYFGIKDVFTHVIIVGEKI